MRKLIVVSFLITPIFFTLAAIVWFFISNLNYTRPTNLEKAEKKNYFLMVTEGFLFFGKSVWVGGKILLTNRRYIWLLPGYSVALYGHRYLENGIVCVSSLCIDSANDFAGPCYCTTVSWKFSMVSDHGRWIQLWRM